MGVCVCLCELHRGKASFRFQVFILVAHVVPKGDLYDFKEMGMYF